MSQNRSSIIITPVRALTDNYCYLVHRENSRKALVIDPSEAMPILNHLNNLDLSLILNTHHHHDHVGGNLELSQKTRTPIFCSQVDMARVPGATRGLEDGEKFVFGDIEIAVIAIPGHTRGQIAYYIEEAAAVFVGDTLFSLGCGRLFEGTPDEMLKSLTKLTHLPKQTQVYVGHEYTEKNALFALSVEPENKEIAKRLSDARTRLAQTKILQAPTIEQELRANPFLRTGSTEIRQRLKLENGKDTEVFARLREMRDMF